MNPVSSQYLIGVDTGGTYTDAAIIEAASRAATVTMTARYDNLNPTALRRLARFLLSSQRVDLVEVRC